MTIREVICYEAWCDAPDGAHLLEFGDYTAFHSQQHVADEVTDAAGLIDMKTGKIYCYDHIPPGLCPDSDTQEHFWDPWEPNPALVSCGNCGAERSTVEAVQP